jgi:hypothetical protein
MRIYSELHSVVYPSKYVRRLVVISILSIFYYLISIISLHQLDTSISPLTQGLSYFAAGPYENLLTAAFIVLGLGGVSVTTGLYLALPVKVHSLAGLTLLGLWSVTTLLAGTFPLDAEGAPQTTAGVIHNLAGMNFLFIAVAALLISRRLKLDRRWQRNNQMVMRMALVVNVASALLFILMGPLNSLEVGGVAQRIYWVAVLGWLSILLVRLWKIAPNHRSSMEV